MRKIGALLVVAMTFVACHKYPRYYPGVRTVKRVWFHEQGWFSIMRIDSTGRVRIEEFKQSCNMSVRIALDETAPAPYIDVAVGPGNIDCGPSNTVVIYVPSLDVVDGADWDHGKFGHGRTRSIR